MAEHTITLTTEQETRIEAYLTHANGQPRPVGIPAPLPLVGVQDFVTHAIGVLELVSHWEQHQVEGPA